MVTVFTWNRKKAAANLRKHGVSFDQAKEVFADPFHITVENDSIGDEQRYVAIGMLKHFALAVVVYVDRSNPDTEIIHIISARKAESYEKILYNAQG
jgi:hypothetical protein